MSSKHQPIEHAAVGQTGPWLATAYEMVSPLSLKLSTATSSGGKSLLLPTPFALKMALLNVAIQDVGLEQGKLHWPAIRDAGIAVCGPQRITVNNTFTRILKPARGKLEADPDTGLIATFAHSIGFREYVLWQGGCRIAVRPAPLIDPESTSLELWNRWLTSINYLGKRGGFIQATNSPERLDDLGDDFVTLTQAASAFSLDGTMQIMDDCSSTLTFEQVDIYSSKKIKLGKDRILRNVVIPYSLERSSRSYSLYGRSDRGRPGF